jgi:bacteriorhodopsin
MAAAFVAVVVAGLLCAIACFHYFKMTHCYQQSGGQFPTALRSMDWLFTTPLLLVTFPLLLRLGDRGARFFWQLVILDVAMIVTAFIAETSPVDSQKWWTFFVISCVFEALIVGVLYLQLGQSIVAAPEPVEGTRWPWLAGCGATSGRRGVRRGRGSCRSCASGCRMGRQILQSRGGR